MVDQTDYTYLAQRFNEQMGLEGDVRGFGDESDAQQGVVKEEFEEYLQAYVESDLEATAEEMADVLITIFIQADRMGIDVSGAFNAKMMYNLDKTGERNDDGKVVDDAVIEKPDFSRFVPDKE